jgi:fructokinase
MTKPTHILCFGEILWDCLPEGLFPGGAPFNVAYHLKCLGQNPWVLSTMGTDFLGRELLRRLNAWKLDTGWIGVDKHMPTGVVLATVDAKGNAAYDIVRDVAWDKIEFTDALQEHLPQICAVVFGSLAQRSETNRKTLLKLLGGLPHARKIFDVNLRPPFDDLEIVNSLAPKSDLVKLNDDEARAILGTASTDIQDLAQRMSSRWGGRSICVTCGAQGAGLYQDGAWTFEPGKQIKVADTVGAGDAFLAGLISALLQDVSPGEALAKACRLGEFTATQRGATPPYGENEKALIEPRVNRTA